MKKNSSPNTVLSTSIAWNTGYNLITQGILLVLAFWAIPILVNKLGNERFGVLALLWAFVGYFSLLDLGISRANIKFLSEAIALEDRNLSSKIVWTSISLSAIFGLISMFIVLAATPYLLINIFKVAPVFFQEVNQAFFFAALSLPFMLIFGTIKGVQMAYLRFDLANVFQGGMSIVQWVGSVVLAWNGYGLKEIMLLTMSLRIVSTIGVLFSLPSMIPLIFQKIRFFDKIVFFKLLHFGGWVTVSQIVSPLFMYLDRILIGAFLSLTAVAYYSVPQEAISRLIIIPVSLSMVLFPVFSGQTVTNENRNKVRDFYYRSIKYLTFFILPITIGIIVYAQEILHIWIGAKFSKESALVFQVIAIGFLFNSIAQVPTTVLYAFGRPDLPAKFHLVELPLLVILNILLIPWIGIVGAGIAWSIRVIFDAFVLLFFARTFVRTTSAQEINSRISHTLLYEILLVLCVSIMLLFITVLNVKLLISSLLFITYILWVWFRGFDPIDRRFFAQLRSRLFK
jgi:O-antigen/teichoic acid export membrane protein